MKLPFKKVLVANRAEIAVRVIRALREQQILSVAVYSEADRDALHVRFATEAYCIGPAPSAESYLNGERILEVAKKCGAEAIHPGYGFLSENASFAQACQDAGIVFIGPSPQAMTLMGNKLTARSTALKAGAPIVPGTTEPAHDLKTATREAQEIGYPVMLKAASGGGGKGMRVVRSDQEMESAFDLTRGEAQSAFGDGTVYLEKFIENPRHIEIQIFGDTAGKVVHLGERECSLQRRHQKIVEEAPSMAVNVDKRMAMGNVAVRIAKTVNYVGAGTVEFIVSEDGSYYFLEMNTRLQVEHPVTELVYGVDLVQEQISVAAGNPLSFSQEDLLPQGWAIECRIYAEDPFRGFMPSLGTVNSLRLASGPGIRNDLGITQGSEISHYYDPMLGKLIASGRTREEARARISRALREMIVNGLRTNISFLRWLINSKEFINGDMDTGMVERQFTGTPPVEQKDREVAAMLTAVIETYERSRRIVPREEDTGRRMNPWRLLGRPGATRQGR